MVRRPRLIRVNSKPPMCIDFMGVLFVRSGNADDGKLIGKVTPGAADFLVDASEHFQINIWSDHTARGGEQAMKLLLVPELEKILGTRNAAYTFLTEEVKWPTQRIDHFLFLDDRGLRFEGTFPDPKELVKFVPWWSKK